MVCVFVDNGLLRSGERAAVAETFGKHSSAELRVVDAADRFLGTLRGVTDPQEKAHPDRPHLHRRVPG